MATPIPQNRACFTAEEVARATGGTLTGTAAGQGVVTDSRAVTKGSIFVALHGETHDAHAFVPSAIERGAAIVVTERGRAPKNVTAVEVDDTLVALGDLAHAHLRRWRSADKRVVAITGSAGKTTTKELTRALLATTGATHATAGNLNNRIGLPAVVFGLEAPHRFLVVEMGMSTPGEIARLAAIAPPDVAIVTNVGVAHAEGVGGREGVMREKGAVYRALAASGVAVVNADDEFAVRAAQETVGRVVTFGRDASSIYRLRDRRPEGHGSRVTIDRPHPIEVALPLPGEAAALDFLAALAAQEAASASILEPAAIEAALEGVVVPGRSAVLVLGDNTLLVDDSYNANPASMRAALATLGEIAGDRRRIAILGEMKELGPLTDDEHTALGDAIADAGLALVIGCGGKIDLALRRAASRGVTTIACASADDAARMATEKTRPGDAILVKGSRSVGAERVIARLTEVLPPAAKPAWSGVR